MNTCINMYIFLFFFPLRYFSSASRTAVLNVLSLEFSGTKLDSQVGSPRIVRQIDWIDKAWPRHLKDLQVETTNNPEDMMYPKVCLLVRLVFFFNTM